MSDTAIRLEAHLQPVKLRHTQARFAEDSFGMHRSRPALSLIIWHPALGSMGHSLPLQARLQLVRPGKRHSSSAISSNSLNTLISADQIMNTTVASCSCDRIPLKQLCITEVVVADGDDSAVLRRSATWPVSSVRLAGETVDNQLVSLMGGSLQGRSAGIVISLLPFSLSHQLPPLMQQAMGNWSTSSTAQRTAQHITADNDNWITMMET